MNCKTQNLNILLKEFKNGSQHAFEEIYKQCYGQIKFLCLKLCSSAEDAEEVLQDTFVTVYKKADTIRDDTFLALLRKIAVDGCYDKLKSNRRKTGNLVYSSDENNFEVEDLDQDFLPEEYLQNKELQSELLQIINNLPPKQREMIYLYYYANINTEEIAKLHNCPSVNIRNILSSARKTIKSQIEGKQKATALQRMAGVSLGVILLVEEQNFTASSLNAATVAPAVSTMASNIFTVATGVIAVCGISIAVYLAYASNTEHIAVEPIAAIEAPQVAEYTPAIEYVIEIDESIYEKTLEENTEETEEIEEIICVEKPPPVVAPPMYTPEVVVTGESDELAEPEPYEPKQPYYELEPPPIDRTLEILAALAAATTPEEVRRIIEHYGFSFFRQMNNITGELLLFYVLDEGSGDILIGIAEYPDAYNNRWRMNFEHYADSRKPSDVLDMFYWMEE